jgi:hypothetical protein
VGTGPHLRPARRNTGELTARTPCARRAIKRAGSSAHWQPGSTGQRAPIYAASPLDVMPTNFGCTPGTTRLRHWGCAARQTFNREVIYAGRARNRH